MQLKTGDRYNRWVVIGKAQRKRYWTCRCDCGNVREVVDWGLTSGRSRSCRCYSGELTAAMNFKHGMAGTPEFSAWMNAIQRCTNPNNTEYHNWGARGITICKEWSESFMAFYTHMGQRPSDRHSLGRIDNSKGYEPGNCRWETPTQQARNKRSNRLITYKGETLSLGEWAERLGMNSITLLYRFKRGWSVKRALTEPIQTNLSRSPKRVV